jgi:opacity protein-like surface antigen
MVMKMKSILGAVLAGALAFGSTLAYAQSGPIYLTPKLLYSNQNFKGFNSTTSGSYITNFNGGDESDSTFGGGIAVGYDFGAAGYSPFRTELEFLARGGAEADFGRKTTGINTLLPPAINAVETDNRLSVKAYTVFANAYYDFANNSNFTPYIGGGLGAAYLDTAADIDLYGITSPDGWSMGGDGTRWNFAWNVGGGVAYQISETMALDLNYRYTNFGEAEAGSRGAHVQVNNNYNPPTTHPFDPNSTADMEAHEFILGLRISGY